MNDLSYSSRFHNLTFKEIPVLTKEEISQAQVAKNFQLFYGHFGIERIAQFAANSFLKLLIHYIDKKVDNEDSSLKYLHFSGHDIVIVGILSIIADVNAFAKRKDKFFPYASFLRIDVEKEENVYLKFSINDEELITRINGKSVVEWSEARKFFKLMILDDYEEQCRDDKWIEDTLFEEMKKGRIIKQ